MFQFFPNFIDYENDTKNSHKNDDQDLLKL